MGFFEEGCDVVFFIGMYVMVGIVDGVFNYMVFG